MPIKMIDVSHFQPYKIDYNFSIVTSYIFRIYVDQYIQWAQIDTLKWRAITHFRKYQNPEFLNNYPFQHLN